MIPLNDLTNGLLYIYFINSANVLQKYGSKNMKTGDILKFFSANFFW
jgi:hypothetical protein